MGLRRLLLALLLPFALAGCGADNIWAPDDLVTRAMVPNEGPASIKLMTVISNRNGGGGHSGLIINGTQRAMFDPAGSFRHPNMPERHDVHYGLTDQREAVYIDYHARVTWHVVTQEIQVPREVADDLMRRVEANGAVPKSFCASSISGILSGMPQFASIHRTMSPKRLMRDFGKLPGVVTQTIYDDDADDNRYVLYVDAATGQPQDD